MKKISLVIIASLAMLLSSCGLIKQVSPMGTARPPYYGNVYVYEEGENIPEGQKLGRVWVAGKALTPTKKCRYEQVVEAAKQKAREIGGNVIVVKNIKGRDGMDTCFRLEGLIYWVEGKEQ